MNGWGRWEDRWKDEWMNGLIDEKKLKQTVDEKTPLKQS